MRWSCAAFFFLLACGSTAPSIDAPPASPVLNRAPIAEVPLGFASGQFLTLSVTVDDQLATAILDTGIGIALVSQALSAIASAA